MDPLCHYCNQSLKGRCKTKNEAEQCPDYLENARIRDSLTLAEIASPSGRMTVRRVNNHSVSIDHDGTKTLPVVIDLDEAERMLGELKIILNQG